MDGKKEKKCFVGFTLAPVGVGVGLSLTSWLSWKRTRRKEHTPSPSLGSHYYLHTTV